MHSPLQHTALPQTRTPWLADSWLVASQYLFRWQPVPILVLAWVHSLLLNQMFWKQCTVRQYHSYLYDQSALEIRVRI